MRLHISAIVAALAVFGQASPASDPPTQAATAEAASGKRPTLPERWAAETFDLPPAFAPILPSGSESLRFSPGWRDPKAEGFWSYAFVMSINEPAPSAARVGELLKTYYDGLTSMFAEGAGKDISGTPARVDVTDIADGKFEAKMRLIDAFATFEPIDVRVLVESVAKTGATSLVCIRLSPQPASHAIWRSLDVAVADLRAHVGAAGATDAKTPPKGADNPMLPYARLIGDEWKLTAPGGKMNMFNTWHWGPGRHSVRLVTDGFGADGKPWRGIGVHYWHPGRKEIRVLGLSPFDRQVSEGVIVFSADAESAQGTFDLHHPTHLRKMGLRWTFLEPGRYHDELLEATGPEGLKPFVAWDHVRQPVPVPPCSLEVPGAEPSSKVKPLTRLVGTWGAEVKAVDANPRRVRSTTSWMPLSDVVYLRVVIPSAEPGKADEHWFDAYLFHHAGTKNLRCLALSKDGEVLEGEVRVLTGDGRAIEADFSGYGVDTTARYALRAEFEPAGGVRLRGWSIAEGDTHRRLLFDDAHTPVPARIE